jgi:hypothetical protein
MRRGGLVRPDAAAPAGRADRRDGGAVPEVATAPSSYLVSKVSQTSTLPPAAMIGQAFAFETASVRAAASMTV